MGAVNEDRPHVIYLNTKAAEPGEGLIEVYDDGHKSRVKAWRAWIIGFKYRTKEDGAQFGLELHIMLGEGAQVADLGILVKSGSFRGICRAIENVNLRQPVTFRPWSYVDEKSGKLKIGGINLEQGGRNIAYKYTDKEPGEMPPFEMVANEEGEQVKNFAKQTAWLRNILDTVIAPQVSEIVNNNLFEPEQVSKLMRIGPGKAEEPAKQLESAATPSAASAPSNDGPPSPEGGDDDDLPF